MKTSLARHFSQLSLCCVALSISSMATAAPSGIGPLYESPQASPSPNSRRCLKTIEGTDTTSNADLDGLNSPCKLDDGEVDKDVFKNDGAGGGSMFNAGNFFLSPQSRSDSSKGGARFKFSLPAGIETPSSGAQRQANEVAPPVYDNATNSGMGAELNYSVVVAAADALGGNRRFGAGVQSGSATSSGDPGLQGQDTIPAIPEPSTWALMLAGASTIGLRCFLRRKTLPA